MKDVKTRPKIAKPKMLEKSQVVPREARNILTGQYRARQSRGQDNGEKSPNQYAVNQIESTMRGNINYVGNVAARSVAMRHRNYIRRGSQPEENAAGGYWQALSDIVQNQPNIEPSNTRLQQAGYSFAQNVGGSTVDQVKKTYRIQKATDAQTEKANIQAAVERIDEKQMAQSLESSSVSSVPSGRSAGQTRRDALFPNNGGFSAKTTRKRRSNSLFRDSHTMGRAGTNAVQKAAASAPKANQAATMTARVVKKETEKQVQTQTMKQAAKCSAQVVKTSGRTAVRIGKVVTRTAAALLKGLIALIGGGPVLAVIIIIGAISGLLASPFGIFFSGEDKSANVTPVSEIVQQINSEFASKIEKIIEDNGNIDSVKYQYGGCATGTVPNNWPDIVAIFAVKTSMNTKNGMDVVTMDARRTAILKQTFWDMDLITSHVETIKHHQTKTVKNIDGTTSKVTITTYEHILHIQITGKTAEEMAEEYSLTKDQRDMITDILANDMRPQMLTLLGIGGDSGLTPEELENLYHDLPTSKIGGQIVQLALSRLGDPYSMPLAGQENYTDCSYLVQWCYKQKGIFLPRTAAEQGRWCVDKGRTISKSDLAPGDLVFWSWGPNDRYMDIAHIGIYAGEGKVVEASSTEGKVICIPLHSPTCQVLYGRPVK